MDQTARSLENTAKLAAMDVMGDVLRDEIKGYPGRDADDAPKWYKEPGWDARHDPKVDGLVEDFVEEKLANVRVVPLRPSETGVFTMARLHEVINPGFVEHKQRMDQLMRRKHNPYEKLETRLLNAKAEALRHQQGGDELLQREREKYLPPPETDSVQGDLSDCFICDRAIERKADEKMLPCGHSIHFSCASSWVAEQMKRGVTVGCGRCGAAISGVPQPVVRKMPANVPVSPKKETPVEPARDPGARDKRPPRAPQKRHSTLSGMSAALAAAKNEA
jgi:hypothetical protein